MNSIRIESTSYDIAAATCLGAVLRSEVPWKTEGGDISDARLLEWFEGNFPAEPCPIEMVLFEEDVWVAAVAGSVAVTQHQPAPQPGHLDCRRAREFLNSINVRHEPFRPLFGLVPV